MVAGPAGRGQRTTPGRTFLGDTTSPGRFRQVVDGFDWAHPLVAAIAAIGVVVVATWTIERSPRTEALGRWRWSLWLAPPAMLGVLQALHQTLPDDYGLLVGTRGFGIVMMLWTMPAAFVFEKFYASRQSRMSLLAVALIAVGVVGFENAVPGRELVGSQTAAAPELREAAVLLADVVPDGGRYVWAQEEEFDRSFGPVHPELWLSLESGANTLNGFGGETITPIDVWIPTLLAKLPATEVQPLLTRAGVTHIVASPAVGQKFLDLDSWTPLDTEGQLWVLERNDGSALTATTGDGLQLEQVSWSPERVEWTIDGSGEAVLAIPTFEKWHVKIDGQEVETGDDGGYLTVTVPPGATTLTATFERSTADWAGPAITLVVIGLWFGLPIWQKRRNRPDDGDGPETAETTGSPGTAFNDDLPSVNEDKSSKNG